MRREREVCVAAAQVHHAQRLGKLLIGGKGRGQRAEERVHLPAFGGAAADHLEERVAGVEQVLLRPVVRGVRCGLGAGAVHLGGAGFGDPYLHRGVRGLHVPVAERFGQQRVDRRLGLRAEGQVPGVRPDAVTGHHLQPGTCLEHDRAQLRAYHRGNLPPAAAGGDRPGEPPRLQQQRPDLGQGSVQRLCHDCAVRVAVPRWSASRPPRGPTGPRAGGRRRPTPWWPSPSARAAARRRAGTCPSAWGPSGWRHTRWSPGPPPRD